MKKGLELSMTVLVVIIISVLIFIGGVSLVYKFFTGAQEIKAGLDKQTEEQIESLLIEGNQLVAVPFHKQTVKRGGFATFGVGIRNIEIKQAFSIALSFSGAFDSEGGRLDKPADPGFIEENWLGSFKQTKKIIVEKNRIKTEPVKIKAGSEIADGIPSPKGNYAFYICVFQGEPQICHPDNRENVYGNVKQVVVEIK